MIKRLPFCLLFLSLAASIGLAAQGPMAAATAKSAVREGVVIDDPLGRSTPQGTVLGFMKAASDQDYGRAKDYLNTKQSPKSAEQLAMELQFIIDRGLSGDLDALSRSPEGDLKDGLPP